jgi:anti-anti-sigma factor
MRNRSIASVGDRGAVTVELVDDGAGARLAGDLDLGAYDVLAAGLEPLFERRGDVVLDIANVSFIDSSAIRLLVRLQSSREDGGAVRLRHPQAHVARVLEVAGVADLGIVVEPTGD